VARVLKEEGKVTKNVNWIFCQNNSDQILSGGMFELRNQIRRKFDEAKSIHPGNYLISFDDQYYIGEAKRLKDRINQQFKPNGSTFYKNFSKREKETRLPINVFQVQYISTNIGRKEVEEFGIVNIPTNLNRFQLGKRIQALRANSSELWLEIQGKSIDLLTEGSDLFFAQNFVSWSDARIPDLAGAYSVKSNGSEKLIYIGESSSISDRYKAHSSSTYFSALRRHIGTELLGFTLNTIKGKKRFFSDGEDVRITEFLHDCRISFLPINFGRFELEDFLIRKHRPLLNRKGNNSFTQ
jgi:predicted GIY-YIG superfamily endonuclease